MVFTCCAPGCKTGYQSEKSRNPSVSLHKFPKDQALVKLWLRKIPREGFTPTSSSRICSLHFRDSDFIRESCDSNKYRRQKTLAKKRLKDDAVPSCFPNLPKYLSTTEETERPSTSASSQARLAKGNVEIENLISKMEAEDHVSDREELRAAFSSCACKPQGFVFFSDNDSDFYLLMRTENSIPHLAASVQVNNDMTIILRYENYKIDVDSYSSFMKFPHKMCCFTDLLNIMSFLKAKAESSASKDSFSFLKSLIDNFVEIVDKHLSELESPVSKSISFLCEQLQLAVTSDNLRRYSNDLYVSSLLWYTSSPACYKLIRESGSMFLPSVRSIQRISSFLPGQEGVAETNYLSVRCGHLEPYEKIVSLVFDEVYVSQRVEYDGAFHGLTDNLQPAKTVLCFMLQSLAGKYKDTVAMFPISKLTVAKLRVFLYRLESCR